MSEDLVVRVETVMDAGPLAVWRALTVPDLVAHWMPGTTVDSTWTEDAPVTWHGSWHGREFTDHGRVITVDPLRRLKMTHSGGTTDPDAHVVTYDLTGMPDGRTKLRVTQENNADSAAVEHSRSTWAALLEGIGRAAHDDDVRRAARTGTQGPRSVDLRSVEEPADRV